MHRTQRSYEASKPLSPTELKQLRQRSTPATLADDALTMQTTLQANPGNLVTRYETLKWLCETHPEQLTEQSDLVNECLSQNAISYTTNYLALANLAHLLARTQRDLLQQSLPTYSATLTSIYDSLLDPNRQERHFHCPDSAYFTALTLMSITISVRLNDVELDASRQGKLHAWLKYALNDKLHFSAPQVHMLARAALSLQELRKPLPPKLIKWLVEEIKCTPTGGIKWRHRVSILKLIHLYAQTGEQANTRLIKDAYRQVFNSDTPSLPATNPLAKPGEKRHLFIDIKTHLLGLVNHLRAEDVMDGIAALIIPHTRDDDILGKRGWWLEQLSLFIHRNAPDSETQAKIERVAHWLLVKKSNSALWHERVLAHDTETCWRVVHALPQFSSLDLSDRAYNTFWRAVSNQVSNFTTEQQVRTLHTATHFRTEILAALFDTIIAQLTPKLAQLTPQDRDNTLRAMARHDRSYSSQACELLYQIAEKRASLTANQTICLLSNLSKVPATNKRKALANQLITAIDSGPRLPLPEACRFIRARALLQFRQLPHETVATTLVLARQSPAADRVKRLGDIWPAMMLKGVPATAAELTQLKDNHFANTPITSQLEKDIQPILTAIANELEATLEKSPWIDSMQHPADFAFKKGSQLVYIEVDGPPHFDHTGKPDMRFYLRKRMYEKAGVEYIAIQITNHTSAIKLKNSRLSPFAKGVWYKLNQNRHTMQKAAGINPPVRDIRVLSGNKRDEADGGSGPARPGAGGGGGGGGGSRAATDAHQHARPRC